MRPRSLAAAHVLLALLAAPAAGQTGGFAPGGTGWGGGTGSGGSLDVGPRYPPDPDARGGRWRHDRWNGPPAGGGWFGPGWSMEGPISPPASFLVPAVPLPGSLDRAVAPSGAVVAPPASPPSARYWYWCADPRGYYPAVPICNGPWQPLAATQTR